MARKKKVSTTEIKEIKKISNPIVAGEKSSKIDIDILINKSYVIDNPLKGTKINIAIQLNNESITNDIQVIKKEYSGITATSKGDSIIIFTGRHSLSKNSKLIEGHLTVRISEI